MQTKELLKRGPRNMEVGSCLLADMSALPLTLTMGVTLHEFPLTDSISSCSVLAPSSGYHTQMYIVYMH